MRSTRRANTPALGAFLEGWRRAARAPSLTLVILALTVGISLPLAASLHREIEGRLGSSAFADELSGEWNDGWAARISGEGSELARTFTREMLGFGGTLATIDDVIGGAPLARPLRIAVGLYVLGWVFLTGGLIDRLGWAAPRGSKHFVSTCARFFWRAARLALLTGAAYWVLVQGLYPAVFDTLIPIVADETSPEPRRIVWRAVAYVLWLALLGSVTLVADFARVRLVIEDRRSAVGALVAGARFVWRRPGRSAWLFTLNVLALAVVARLWLQIAPAGAGPTWVAVLAGQAYLVARIIGRIGVMGSEVVFLQGETAHATYVAAPAAAWPASVSVEALRAGARAAEQKADARVG